jgi:hypothetical protein
MAFTTKNLNSNHHEYSRNKFQTFIPMDQQMPKSIVGQFALLIVQTIICTIVLPMNLGFQNTKVNEMLIER